MGTPRPICKSCGARRAPEYRHKLTKSLVRGLRHFIEKHRLSEGELSEVNLTYSVRCNFQKLRYFGLVEKVGDPKGKGGKWVVTRKGFHFSLGNWPTLDIAVTYQGRKIQDEGKHVYIQELLDGWIYRPGYRETATKHEPNQMGLFRKDGNR